MRTDRSTGFEEDQKRSVILVVALDLFARYGFKKTTMGDIAKAAHIGKATIYNYFESKEAVFAAGVESHCLEFSLAISQAVETATTHEEKIRVWLSTRMDMVRKLLKDIDFTDEALFELLPLAREAKRKHFDQEIGFLEELIVNGKNDGVYQVKYPHIAANALFLAIRGIDIVYLRYHGSPDLEATAKEMLEIFIRGLKTR